MTTFKAGADFLHPTAVVKPCGDGNGVHVKFPNEWVVSVQWGPCTYSSNHRAPFDFPPQPDMEAATAEIAAWQSATGMIEWPDGDTVQGWKTWDEVQSVLDAAEAGTLSAADVAA